jgi:biotin carboxylase
MTTESYRAGAFLDAARAMGVAAVVGSERTPTLAAANPAGHLTLDFLRPERAVERVVEFNLRHPLRAVLAADDDGAVVAAAAAEALGLEHHPVAAVRAARDKHRMRQVLRDAGVPGPAFRDVAVSEDPAAVAAALDYPCVLKPRHLSGSRGVLRADDPRGFVDAFAKVAAILRDSARDPIAGTHARSVLVESFIPGPEVAVEGMVTRGRLRVLAIYDKPDPLDGPYFEESLYVTPSRHPEPLQRAITDRTQEVVTALGLAHGPIHAEMRLGPKGPWPVEIAPRSIGGLCSRTLRFGDGVSLEELILRHAVGLDVGGLARERGSAGVLMIPIPKRGRLRAVRGREQAEGVLAVEEVRISIPVGQPVVPPPEGARYLGFVFARAATPAQTEAALREAHALLDFDID